MRILGVDPGSEHIGIAVWDDDTCVDTFELTPFTFAQMVSSDWSRQFDEAWAENYVPQGGFGNASTGVNTLKILGYFEWYMRMFRDVEVGLVTRLDRDASLQRLKGARYPFRSPATPDHARSAECVVVAGRKITVSRLKAARPW